jgi:hypothetical protein
VPKKKTYTLNHTGGTNLLGDVNAILYGGRPVQRREGQEKAARLKTHQRKQWEDEVRREAPGRDGAGRVWRDNSSTSQQNINDAAAEGIGNILIF